MSETPKMKAAIDALRSAADELNEVHPGGAAEYTKPLQNLTNAIEVMKEAAKSERYTSEAQEAMADAMGALQSVIYKLLSISKDNRELNARGAQ
jgi:hypothetical protein